MRRPGMLVVAATAWVGVVAGHLAACVLAYPNEAGRHVHLHVTGHTWVGFAAPSLFAIIPVILLAVGIGAVKKGPACSGGSLAVRLMAIQMPAFILIELFVQQGSLGRILTDPAIFIGLVLQPLVAVIAAWIMDLLQRAVRSVVVRLLRTSRRIAPRSFPRPVLQQPTSRHGLLVNARRRAPPLPSAA